jgi:hypothetical protein
MLTLNLSFESLHFISTQFESCEVPTSPLISFHFLSPYKFCVNSIPWGVFIFYHPHLVVHRSCLDTHLYFYSLKIPSLPPQFESSSLPIWPLDVFSPFPFTGPILTPSCMVLISFVLCLLPPPLHPWLLLPLKPSWYICPCLPAYFEPTLQSTSFPSLFEDKASSISSLTDRLLWHLAILSKIHPFAVRLFVIT